MLGMTGFQYFFQQAAGLAKFRSSLQEHDR
jgi:hypothetical protein